MKNFQPETQVLAKKTILVTGAGDGIGRVAAMTYAEHGATVILLGKTTAKLEAVYDEIVNKGWPEPAIVPLDLNGASKKHYQDMAQTIKAEFGQLDGLLHNAGVLGVLSPFEHLDLDTWQKNPSGQSDLGDVDDTSADAGVSKSPHASVIFTSSGVGRKSRAFWGGYAVSKFATEGLMQTIADEYEASTIRTNCINPGATRTKMRNAAYPGENQLTLATPEQIMPLYLYLMADDSIGVNGQSLDAQPK